MTEHCKPDPVADMSRPLEPWIGNCPKCHTPWKTNPPRNPSRPLDLKCGRPECDGVVRMTPIGGFQTLSDKAADNPFSDWAIIAQSLAMLEVEGSITNGFALTVQCPEGANEVTITLVYDEVKAALADLEADREAMPHLYTDFSEGQ